MNAPTCSRHQVEMEIAPAEPRSRCRACGYLTHHLRFSHCPECGQRLLIEEPAPHWHCPLCAPAGRLDESGAHIDRKSHSSGEDARLGAAAHQREPAW